MTAWLRWGPPILAALTALLEAAHEGNLFSSELIVLIFAILTAVTAFTAAITGGGSDADELARQAKKAQPKT